MTIRQAQAGDAPAIAAIWNRIIVETAITFTDQTKSVEEIAALIADRGAAFQVVELAGRCAGFATYGSFRSGPGYVRTVEHTILLAHEAQGHGSGRALMMALEQVAKAAGIHSLIGGVSGENPSGIAFHKAVGFSEVGRLPEVGFKFGRWMDLVLVQKHL